MPRISFCDVCLGKRTMKRPPRRGAGLSGHLVFIREICGQCIPLIGRDGRLSAGHQTLVEVNEFYREYPG